MGNMARVTLFTLQIFVKDQQENGSVLEILVIECEDCMCSGIGVSLDIHGISQYSVHSYSWSGDSVYKKPQSQL